MFGTVVRVILDRGFGFVKCDAGQDYFFHCSMLNGLDFTEQLTEQRVRFDMSTDARTGKPKAVNVRAA